MSVGLFSIQENNQDFEFLDYSLTLYTHTYTHKFQMYVIC